MKNWVRIFACAVSVMGCAFVLGCDDDSSSVAPRPDDIPASSAIDVGTSSAVNPGSSDAISSAVVESSSSVSVPSKFCHFSMVTKTGYYPMVVTTGVTSICLPLAECDTSLINLGFAYCYEEQATPEGCFTEVTVTEKDVCEEQEKTCDTPNGTAQIFGRFSMSCSNIVR